MLNAAVQVKSASAVLPEISSKLNSTRALAAIGTKVPTSEPAVLWTLVIHLCGEAFFQAFVPAADTIHGMY
jgi:hypothetical protein